MNLVSLKQELAEIIREYASFQSTRPDFKNYAARLTIKPEVYGDLSEEDQISKLENLVNIINSQYPTRAAHLKLIIALIRKMNAVDAYINDIEHSEQEAQLVFEDMKNDIDKLLRAYAHLLHNTTDAVYLFTPFSSDAEQQFHLNTLREETSFLNPTTMTGVRLKQLGTHIRDQITTLNRSLNSEMNSLKIAEDKKKIIRLERDVFQLTEKLSQVSESSEQSQQNPEAFEQLQKENALLKQQNISLKKQFDDLKSFGNKPELSKALDVIEKHGVNVVREKLGIQRQTQDSEKQLQTGKFFEKNRSSSTEDNRPPAPESDDLYPVNSSQLN